MRAAPRPDAAALRRLTPEPTESQRLAQSLQRLDGVLEEAIAAFESAFERTPDSATFRGLCVSGADASRWLALPPGDAAWSAPAHPHTHPHGTPRFLCAEETSRLARLQQRFGLDAFETDALLIAASPDLDQRYERLFGLLQDDVTRRRPTLATVVHLAATHPVPQWLGVGRFAGGHSALQRSGLVRVVADPAQSLPTLGSHWLVADVQTVHFLSGHDTLALPVQSFCDWLAPQPMGDFNATWRRHPEVAHACHRLEPHPLRFVGATAWERRHLAHAVASHHGLGLLCLRLAHAQDATRSEAEALAAAQLAARLHNALLFIEAGTDGGRLDSALARGATHPGPCIVSRAHAVAAEGARHVEVRLPTAGERRARWQGHLHAAGRHAEPHDLDDVAHAFALDTEQTDAAAASACATPGGPWLERPSLFAAARQPLALHLPRALNAVEPQARWEHLILPADTLQQLHDVCVHVRQRSRVLHDWGFGEASSRGQGVNVLLSGSSGTGKSTACEVLAHELGRTLLKIDLSQTVSKYLGESEKQLAEVFDIAERSGAVLMFDEADALLGKRTGITDAHDRHANTEVSYLLQRIEAFTGILVLTTNLQANMDSAFVRRLQFIIEFTFPDEAQRAHIWAISVPARAPRDPDLDAQALARRYAVAGGSIRNIALSAAMLAASRHEAIGMRHMAHAARREYQKLGKALPEGDCFAQGAPR